MAFATVEDLEARWHPLTDEQKQTAAVLLEDAGAMLAAYVSEPDECCTYNLKVVSCNMVKRAMVSTDSDAFGIDQLSATMGPFQQSAHYANPSGDMYISAAERRLLGIGSDFITSMRAKVRHA